MKVTRNGPGSYFIFIDDKEYEVHNAYEGKDWIIREMGIDSIYNYIDTQLTLWACKEVIKEIHEKKVTV